MFLSEYEQQITDEYIRNGYTIQKVADLNSLDWIKESIADIIRNILGLSTKESSNILLNQIHKKVSVSDLNSFRLKVIQSMNSLKDFRYHYYKVAKPYLETLVGNELSMQLRVNLSIQFPKDDSSLLPVHSDTWSGDSPYEIVVWLPIVDCYKTKSMYLLPPNSSKKLISDFKNQSGISSEDLFQSISKDVQWLEVKYGEILLFDQGYPHGNRVNEESDTRWSMNCRFKSVFTPYGDKKLGEFFEPITLRATSKIGMEYQFPKVK
ncbi:MULTISPECIES: sporadic carbohydrate cluster 2OG-Fe(II) oxygenase [Leptospira]|uniref:Sporadic carbohydrate cluster 2OG-Fe(II) oxygenase n=2 Tax=Leptospira borgpetersenii TaxID=174 RepID=A0AAV3J8G1_LEPBO|nr:MULTISPECIES: sporadic carbohydrate cluster 2OG-Fe(II) oxygenase [Leptospira]AXX16269.1 2OG-Fe(II) oxygenase [Leptospira borgpetersenii serovar Ceylonica]EKQ90313.1 sporadic carbohydrate cluster 2OG-Fe(II) oxygenase [Leptospira borgpetersenii str. UI 09149]EMK08884.1 sporadic carbohydrate cluster 2OG-Fe(II) oxygenase [Leptospira sp. serovar Kenya str. Sh9]EMN58447.1 sporadic carbohydrate cluster 2OG-Fe(II) oxygenase [Leptospira borgpetersenii serovar Javanica str. MK146]EPG56265.1 sporadic 